MTPGILDPASLTPPEISVWGSATGRTPVMSSSGTVRWLLSAQSLSAPSTVNSKLPFGDLVFRHSAR